MYFWQGTYVCRDKYYVIGGLFYYENPDNAVWEAELLADLMVYKFLKGVPMGAKLVKCSIVFYVN